MFFFLQNVKDWFLSYIGIGIHSYKPKGFKGIFPLQILSYKIPTKILQTKGGLNIKLVQDLIIYFETERVSSGSDTRLKSSSGTFALHGHAGIKVEHAGSVYAMGQFFSAILPESPPSPASPRITTPYFFTILSS